MNKPRIILAGGSGFLGGILSRSLLANNYEVVLLTRSPAQRNDAAKEIAWDGRSIGDWAGVIDGAMTVINLAGRSVDCRYTARNRRLIVESRVHSTRVLGEAISRCKQPPEVWLNSSTATIYKHSLDKPMDESGETGATPEAKDAFSIEVARTWEKTLEEAHTPETRKVALRTAMVLGCNGGVFPVLRRLVRTGLGGRMGNGRQFVSWLHEDDFCQAIQWIISDKEMRGTINLSAPNPIENREMMQTLRRIHRAPFGLPATLWMLEIGAFILRTETELITKSRRVIPRRLVASGYQFSFPKFEDACKNLESRMTKSIDS